MPNPPQIMIKKPEQGRSIALGGDINRFVAISKDTGGSFSQWEVIVPPGGGPVPHLHSREIESFFVMEGSVVFQIEDNRVEAPTGTFVLAPIGIRHSFKNETQSRSRILITVAPAGLEEFFFKVGTEVDSDCEVAQPVTHEEVDRILTMAPLYGLEIQLPSHSKSNE